MKKQEYRWQLGAASHIGGRREQQDSVALFSSPEEGLSLLVLADGMGGHSGGLLASQTVVEIAEKIWLDWLAHRQKNVDPKLLLWYICEASHYNINARGEKEGVSPRSTVVLLYLNRTDAYWAHIGDSRLYCFRHGQYASRSSDHSLVQLLFNLKRIREDEMATHPDQNLLVRCLGGESDPDPDFGHARLGHDGEDSFLLCSDGLWEALTPQDMEKILSRFPDPQEAAEQMVQLVVRRTQAMGDNLTVAIAVPESVKPHRRKALDFMSSIRMVLDK